MPGDAILTYDDYVVGAEKTPGAEVIMPAGPRDYADYLAYYHLQHTGDPLPDVPQAPLPDAVLQVNAGRWVFQCDTCDGGTLVKPDHPVICVFCGHQWRQPRFPGERAAIEAELLKQPGRRLFAPIRNWKYGWTLAQLQDRTRRANEKVAAGQSLVRALSIGATRVWTAGETLSASNMNLYVSDVADDLAGRNGVVELENGLRIIAGNGSRYLGLPAGAETQRPASPAEGMVRFNSTDGAIDVHNGTAWEQVLTSKALTYANLNARGLVGPGAAQVAQGNHTHVGTPEAPTGLTATANQSTKRVSLSWTAPTNNGGSAITGYVVYRTGQSSGSYTLTGTGTTYTTPVLSPGSYTFTVAAVNSIGTGTVSSGATATINAATLRVSISGNSSATPGSSVSLTASVTGGIAPYSYSWSGSGVSGSGSSATVTRSNAGGRTATVTVTDSAGTQATDTHTVTFSYPTLSASISAPATGTPNANLHVSCTASGGSGGYSYAWIVTGESGENLSGNNTSSGIVKRGTPGSISLSVTVTDSAGSTATDTHTITIS